MHIIWTKVLNGDNAEAATARATARESGAATHYWDPKQLVGRALKRQLEVGASPLAWDVYMFFRKGTTWNEAMPQVSTWAHQLRGAERERFFGGRIAPWVEKNLRALKEGKRADSDAPRKKRELITVDPKRLDTVSLLLLEDVLTRYRSELPERDRATFDRWAAEIRKRYVAAEKQAGFAIPKGLRLNKGIVAVPEPSCLPPDPQGSD